MNNNIVPFVNDEFGTVRTVVIDSEPWFVAADVSKALEIVNHHDALTRLDDDEKSGVALTDPHGREQITNIVNEPGLYSLVLRSRKPEAKAFKRWIVHEVVPAIRKHGLYAIDDLLANPDLGIAALQALKAEREKNKELTAQVAIQSEQIEELKPKATYYDVVLNCKDLVPTTLIAKDFGMSAQAMNEKLHDFHVQFKQGRTWVLYSKYQNSGYAQTVTVPYNNHGKTGVNQNLKWTQKGRYMIYEIMKRHNILPIVERV